MESIFQAKIRDALIAVKLAISDGWADTRRQIAAVGYDPRITQSAFGQFLVHNVMNRTYRLNDSEPNLQVELRPNKNNAAHHAVVRVEHVLMTVSAISAEYVQSRPALFREEYASLQGSFGIDAGGNFVPLPPEEMDSVITYIQVLHGPSVDDREQNGFTLVAFYDQFNERKGKPVRIDDFLAQFPAQMDDAEIIEENIDIKPRKRINTKAIRP